MARAAMPDLMTHIYHPGRGAFRNICELDTAAAYEILAAMRGAGRPKLTPDYLFRRHVTEAWLRAAAAPLLGRMPARPLYGFLGSFGHSVDPSRPLAVRIPLAELGTVTFTLGDSMGAAARPGRRLYDVSGLSSLFEEGAMDGWQLSDQAASPPGVGFVEVQLWERDRVQAISAAT